MSCEILTSEQLAGRLQVSERTVIGWANRKLIPEVRPTPRCRRFDYAEVITALKDRTERTQYENRNR